MNIPDRFTINSIKTASFSKKEVTEQELLAFYKHQLLQEKNTASIDNNRFAQVLGDGVIGGTAYSGASPVESFNFWKRVLELCHLGQEPFPVSIDSVLVSEMLLDIEDLLLSDSLMELKTQKVKKDWGSESTEQTKPELANTKKIIETIAAGLEKRNRFVLSLQHCGTGYAEGHHFAWVISRCPHTGQLSGRFYNKGDGLEIHPPSEFCSDDYLFNDPQFFNPESKLTQTLIQIFQAFRMKGIVPAGASRKGADFYGILEQVAKKKPKPIVNESLLIISPSLSGTCSEQAARLMIRDQVLYHSNYENKELRFKRLIFNGKFQALREGINSSAIDPYLFERGIQEFTNSARKLIDQNSLNREESCKVWALIELAQEKLKTLNPPTTLLPSFSSEFSFFKNFKPQRVDKPVYYFESKKLENTIFEREPYFFDFKKITPKTFKDTLQALIHNPNEPEHNLHDIPRFVDALPIPKSQNDSFWDEISLEDIKSSLNLFNRLAESFLQTIRYCQENKKPTLEDSEGLPLILLTMLSLYSIADKMCRRLPDVGLNGYTFSVPLESIDRSFYYKIGSQSKRLEEIVNYFTEIQKQHKARIFPYIWQTYRIDTTAIKDLCQTNQGVIGDHLMFVDQFLRKQNITPAPSAYFENLSLEYIHGLAVAFGTFFPREIYLLKYLADTAFNFISLTNVSLNHYYHALTSGLTGVNIKISNTSSGHCDIICKSQLSSIKSPKPKDDLIAPFEFKKLVSAGKSENQIMLKAHGVQDRELESDITKIIEYPQFRIPLLIKWCLEHLSQLEISQRRNLIEFLFLEKNYLRTALSDEPLLLDQIRSLIGQQLDSILLPSRYDEVLKWSLFAAHVESHALLALGEMKIDEIVAKLDQWFQKVSNYLLRYPQVYHFEEYKFHFYSTRAYIFGLLPKMNEKQIIQFLQALTLRKYFASHDYTDYLLQNFNNKRALYYHWLHIKKTLETDSETLQKTVESISQAIGVHLSLHSLDFPNIICTMGADQYIIDLEKGLITRKGDQIIDSSWPQILVRDKLISALFPKGLPKLVGRKCSKTGVKILETLDCSFKIEEDRDYKIYKKIKIEGKSVYFQFQEDEGHTKWQYSNNIPSQLFYDKFVWIQKEGNSPENLTVILENLDCTQYAKIFINTLNNSCVIERVEISHKTERLLEISHDHPLVQFFHLFDYSDTMVAWGIETKEGPKLSSFELVQFNRLSFHIENGVPQSSQYPEYCLSQVQAQLCTGVLPGALNLEKIGNPNQKMVIIPYRKSSGGTIWSEPIKGFWNDNLNISDSKEKNYLVYNIDEKTGLMVAPSQESYLQLIHLLVGTNQYREAENYLHRLQWNGTLNKSENSIVNQLLSYKDESVEGTRFKLKVALKVIELLKMSHFSRLNTNKISFEDYFWTNVKKNLSRYLYYRDKSLTYAAQSPPIPIEDILELHKYASQSKSDSDVVSGIQFGEDILQKTKEKRANLYELDSMADFYKHELSTSFIRSKIENKAKEVSFDLFQYLTNDHIWESFYPLCGEAISDSSPAFDLKFFYICKALMSSKNSYYQSHENLLPIVLIFQLRQNREACLELIDKNLLKNKDQITRRLLDCFAKWQDNPTQPLLPATSKITPSPVKAKPPRAIPEKKVPKLIQKQETIIQVPFSIEFPLKKIFTDLFKGSPRDKYKPNEKEFVLAGRSQSDPISINLLENLRTGFNLVKDRTYLDFTTSTDINSIHQNIHSFVKDLQLEARRAQQEIERLLNYPSESDLDNPNLDGKLLQEYRLELAGGKKTPFTLSEAILKAAFSKDTAWIQEKNPLLSKEQIELLYQKLMTYQLIHCAVDQANEALACEDTHSIAEVLSKRRLYIPTKEPLLLLYEYASGKILRTEPDQAKLLATIFEIIFKGTQGLDDVTKLRKLFFEFQAGGGKTKVISAIVAAMAVSQGKCPVFISLPEIFDITKKDLQESFSNIFSKHVAVIDFALNTPFDEARVREVAKRLQKGLKNGDFFVITPETFYALKLSYHFSLSKENTQMVYWHSVIEEFFRTHAIALIDELHRNAFSLLQANTAMGDPRHIDKWEQALMLYSMKELMGIVQNPMIISGRKITDVFDLKGNNHAAATKKTLEDVLSALADKLLESDWLAPLYRNQETYNDLKKYLLNLNARFPAAVMRGNLEPLYLSRGLLTFILPHTLRLVGEIDHGLPINQKDEIEAPRKQKNPTTARFELPDVASVLSIQGYFQRGLSTYHELKQLVLYLKDLATKEAVNETSLAETPTAKNFMRWQQGAERVFTLEELNSNNPYYKAFLRELSKSLGKHPEAIEIYLSHFVLPRVQIYPYKMTMTAQDLMRSFFSSVMFSATLGSLEQYQTVEDLKKQFLEDLPFPAEVVQRASLPHNSTIYWLSQREPLALFEALFQIDSKRFDRIEGTLDMGRFKSYSSREIANAFIEFANKHDLFFDGAVFFEREILQEGTLGEKSLYYINKAGEIVKLKGTTLPKGRVFKIFAPEDTTGTDLTLSSTAVMLLLLGEGNTFSLIVQTIMRMRGFLKNPISPVSSQSLIWVGTPELEEKIQQEVSCSYVPKVPECFLWGILNEGFQRKQIIIQRTYQEIEHEVRSLIYREMEQKNPQEQIALHKIHERAFRKDLGRNLKTMYGLTSIEIPTSEALTAYSNNLADIAHVRNLKGFEAVSVRIDRIIAITHELISTINEKVEQDLSCCGQMQAEVAQLQKQEEHATTLQESNKHETTKFSESDALPIIPYAEKLLQLNSNVIFQPSSAHHRPLSEVFQYNQIPLCLGIADNALRTVKDHTAYKPIEFFLVLEDDGLRRALIVSMDDAEYYKWQMRHMKLGSRKAALYTSIGKLAARSGFTPADLKGLEASNWFLDVVTACALFSSRMRLRERLTHVFESDFSEVVKIWEHVRNHALLLPLTHLKSYEGLIKKVMHSPQKMNAIATARIKRQMPP